MVNVALDLVLAMSQSTSQTKLDLQEVMMAFLNDMVKFDAPAN